MDLGGPRHDPPKPRSDPVSRSDTDFSSQNYPPSSFDSDCHRSLLAVVLFYVELVVAGAIVLYALCFIVLKCIRKPSSKTCPNCSKPFAASAARHSTDKPGKKDPSVDAYQSPYSTIDVDVLKSAPGDTNRCSKNIQKIFTLAEVMQITDNMRVKLGQGGFGAVYYGKLSTGQKVAVKRLSSTSSQGATEFVNEVELTSRVSHENLVSVIGHCCELNERILVYEYMPRGALQDHLYGREAERETLDWQQRLRIAIDTARGLDYLHTVCEPPIIHRDVKSSNILLDSSFHAKVADFGISKLWRENIENSNGVKGTVGYLDPEYFSSQRSNDKSDVYGFGIVLLELICGRQALVPQVEDPSIIQNIVDWVDPYLKQKDFHAIVDKSIRRRFNREAMEQALDIALMCVKHDSSSRPSMKDICERLKKVLKIELKEKCHGHLNVKS